MASEYSWTVDDIDRLTPGQTIALLDAIKKRKEMQRDRDLYYFLPIDDEQKDLEFKIIEEAGKRYIKVQKTFYRAYELESLFGRLQHAVCNASRPLKETKLKDHVKEPAWQKVIDKERLRVARQAALDRGLKVPGVK